MRVGVVRTPPQPAIFCVAFVLAASRGKRTSLGTAGCTQLSAECAWQRHTCCSPPARCRRCCSRWAAPRSIGAGGHLNCRAEQGRCTVILHSECDHRKASQPTLPTGAGALGGGCLPLARGAGGPSGG